MSLVEFFCPTMSLMVCYHVVSTVLRNKETNGFWIMDTVCPKAFCHIYQGVTLVTSKVILYCIIKIARLIGASSGRMGKPQRIYDGSSAVLPIPTIRLFSVRPRNGRLQQPSVCLTLGLSPIGILQSVCSLAAVFIFCCTYT